MKLLLIAIGLIGVLVVSEAAPRWDYIPDENEQADELIKRDGGGIFVGVANCFQWGVNYKGNDLTPVKERKVDGPAACQKLCLDTEGCKFWTMNTVKSCWLKTSDAGIEEKRTPGVISGSKNSHMCLDYEKGEHRYGPGDKDYSWLGLGDCAVGKNTGGKKATLFEMNDEGGNKCFEKCDATSKCSAVEVGVGLCKGYENKSGWRWFLVFSKSQKKCYAKARNCDDCYNFPK